ncbi:HNH endonuclease signature motif containing protein [Mycolicibacterium mengxianglii]|uniref:HNH endonuclease signature motif containing protein n=1 Tax=Mycolicibacterium mengxianglii TaxID=2736649 RepID=UPI0018D14B56|nr:HNH endonuclease signature motif containing protein [Mycolicibacterium mengxianglii]
MFDELPDSALRAEMSDTEVADAVSAWTRAVASAAAHRLLFIGELTSRKYDEDWEIAEEGRDNWDSTADEVAAASGISHGRASVDMEVGTALGAKLPKIADLLLAGKISEYLARRIAKRTELIQDRKLLAQVEAAIADRAINWGGLSQKKLDTAIDVWVNRYDPGALKQTRVRVRDRGIDVLESKDGITDILMRLKGADAALFYRRVTVMANGVCKDDPRTFKQRCADASGALGAGFFHLACECGNPSCEGAVDDGRASSVVVYIYGEEAALTAHPDPYMDGDSPLPAADEVSSEAKSAEAVAAAEPESAEDGVVAEDLSDGSIAHPAQRPPAPQQPPAGVILGFGAVPAPLLAALIAAGAKTRHLAPPRTDPEARYRPSIALDEWVRARDLTCRFPHCDRPAEFCDWDHTVPWPAGLTHASGGKLLCRKHHLLKTFHSGWSDVQHPDGTIVWATPTGQTFTTKPGSSLFFPTVNTTSAPIVTGTPAPNSPGKALKMPKRKRSRAKERDYRIKAERALNDAHVAEQDSPPF